MDITFTAYNEYWDGVIPPPKPAKLAIPDWYKKQSLYSHGQTDYAVNGGTPNTTVKGCTPFSDALMSGYIWEAPVDIQVTQTPLPNGDKQIHFQWRVKDSDFVTFHDLSQHDTMPPAYAGERGVCKWHFQYLVNTPPGTSCLFTHPLNRHELPFRTFSGVVDSDEYDQPVQFPFQLLHFEGERIIIERGTPLVQIIPFKRDVWDSTTIPFDEKTRQRADLKFWGRIYRSYKSQYWTRKDYR